MSCHGGNQNSVKVLQLGRNKKRRCVPCCSVFTILIKMFFFCCCLMDQQIHCDMFFYFFSLIFCCSTLSSGKNMEIKANGKNSCHCSSMSTLGCLDGINIRWKRLEQNEFGRKYKML